MTDPDPIIRHASTSDLTDILGLFTDTITNVCANDYTDQEIQAWISSVENTQHWLDKINRQYFLIAQIGNKIVGFGSLENGNHVDMMYVHKDYQHQGIARKLLSKIEREAIENGASTIHSDVSKSAMPFFKIMGYKVIVENRNETRGVVIVNFRMEKKLVR